MAQGTLVQSGRDVDYTPTAAVVAGDVVVQNKLVGVASRAIAANALGSLITDGVFDIVKITGAITAGVEVFWDPTGDPVGGVSSSGAATTTAGSLELIGWAVLTAASADTVVRVKFANVSGLTVHNERTKVIADPGASGAIPVTSSGHVALVSAGVETRTMAAPTADGQVIMLFFKTDAGDITLTVASLVNETGDNTLVFSDAGEVIELVGISEGATARWRVVHNDGVVLSTV